MYADLSSICDARELKKGHKEQCFCSPPKVHDCDCDDDDQVSDAATRIPNADIDQFGHCTKNSDCDKVCFPTCKFRVCTFKRTCNCTLC